MGGKKTEQTYKLYLTTGVSRIQTRFRRQQAQIIKEEDNGYSAQAIERRSKWRRQ